VPPGPPEATSDSNVTWFTSGKIIPLFSDSRHYSDSDPPAARQPASQPVPVFVTRTKFPPSLQNSTVTKYSSTTSERMFGRVTEEYTAYYSIVFAAGIDTLVDDLY
jgi:hypothetical protein